MQLPKIFNVQRTLALGMIVSLYGVSFLISPPGTQPMNILEEPEPGLPKVVSANGSSSEDFPVPEGNDTFSNKIVSTKYTTGEDPSSGVIFPEAEANNLEQPDRGGFLWEEEKEDDSSIDNEEEEEDVVSQPTGPSLVASLPEIPAPGETETSSCVSEVIYVVQSGDCVWQLVRRFYQCKESEIQNRIALLKPHNPDIDMDNIRVGQKIKFPGLVSSKQQFENKRKELQEKLPKVDLPTLHRVKKGDTLYTLALYYYRDEKMWLRISEANGKPNPQKLKENALLQIPLCQPQK